MSRWQQCFIAILMGIASVAAWQSTPHRHMAQAEPVDLAAMVPSQFDGWTRQPATAVVVESPEREANLRSIYTQVLSEVYANARGETVMLSIAYTESQGDNSGKQSHKPEICYTAQGFQISKVQRAELPTSQGVIPVKRMLAVAGSRSEPLTYWTTIGHRVPASELEAKFDLLAYGFRGDVPDGVVFRVSSLSENAVQAYGLQQTFISALVAAMSPAARSRLAGLGKVGA